MCGQCCVCGDYSKPTKFLIGRLSRRTQVDIHLRLGALHWFWFVMTSFALCVMSKADNVNSFLSIRDLSFQQWQPTIFKGTLKKMLIVKLKWYTKHLEYQM